MEEVDGIINHSGRTYITIRGQKHEAYTAKEFVERRGWLEHDITSEEYVRQCCRQQAERTGRVAKLPDGWGCAKHQGRIYVYRQEQAYIKSLPEPKMVPAWQETLLDPDTELRLRYYKRDAAILGEPIEVKIVFNPNGSSTCMPTGNLLERAQLTSAILPFILSWETELIGIYRHINAREVRKIIEDRLNEFFHSSTKVDLLSDFRKRCLWCAHYRKSGQRSDSRFCNKHKVAFSQWKKKTTSTYKHALIKEPFKPNPQARSVWCSEFLHHPVVANALHDRLQEISPVLAPSVIRKQKALN